MRPDAAAAGAARDMRMGCSVEGTATPFTNRVIDTSEPVFGLDTVEAKCTEYTPAVGVVSKAPLVTTTSEPMVVVEKNVALLVKAYT